MMKKLLKYKKRIYLDYAASAPILPDIKKVVTRALNCYFANPSSIHQDGISSKKALEDMREMIAGQFGARKKEIFFTSGGTESNGLAILGVYEHARKLSDFKNKKPHIITTNIEHSSVLQNIKRLGGLEADITIVDVEKDGIVLEKKIREAVREETILISIGYANNEIGTIQPVKEIAKIVRRARQTYNNNFYPVFHIDACQAVSYLDISVAALGVDILTWNSSKIGGPRGVGGLYIKEHTPIDALVLGGGQEFGLRSGTENVPGIIGFAKALKITRKKNIVDSARQKKLRDDFFESVRSKFPEVRINGNQNERLPNNINISFKNFSSELLVLELDARGIAVSAGSACDGVKDSGSHIIGALYGEDDNKIWGTIRITFGSRTTKKELDYLIKALEEIFNKYKKAL